MNRLFLCKAVEWLIGVPIGWLSLEPVGMGSYQQWWSNFYVPPGLTSPTAVPWDRR